MRRGTDAHFFSRVRMMECQRMRMQHHRHQTEMFIEELVLLVTAMGPVGYNRVSEVGHVPANLVVPAC